MLRMLKFNAYKIVCSLWFSILACFMLLYALSLFIAHESMTCSSILMQYWGVVVKNITTEQLTEEKGNMPIDEYYLSVVNDALVG